MKGCKLRERIEEAVGGIKERLKLNITLKEDKIPKGKMKKNYEDVGKTSINKNNTLIFGYYP